MGEISEKKDVPRDDCRDKIEEIVKRGKGRYKFLL